MKATRIAGILASLLTLVLLPGSTITAQDGVPAELQGIVNMNMDAAQEKLEGLGYEICAVHAMKKTEDWYNESTKHCITLKFDKKTELITEVMPNPNTAECEKGLENSRKLWENYHDGQAPVANQKIDEERQKLASEGYKVSYWVNDVSPGRTAEYWINESSQKAMLIVWETEGNKWVMTNSTDYSMGKNPAPNR